MSDVYIESLLDPALRHLEEIEMAKEKACNVCGESKPLTEFKRNAKTKDGYALTCRICKNNGKRIERVKDEMNDVVLKRKKPALDLSGIMAEYPDVMEALTEQAVLNLRPIEYQAAFYIVAALKSQIEA